MYANECTDNQVCKSIALTGGAAYFGFLDTILFTVPLIAIK